MQSRILRALALILLTVMGTRYSFGQTFNSGDRSFNSGDHFFNINTSTVGGDSVTTVICKEDGPLYVVQLQGDKVLAFTVDGRSIPLDGLGKYQSVIDSIKVEVKEAERQAKLDREQADRDRQQAELDREQANRDREQAERDRQQSEQERQQSERDRLQAEQDRQQADRDRVQARMQAEQDRQQAERDRQQAERDREQAERDREQANRDRVRAEEDRKMMDSLMNDLVADGIVPDRDSVRTLKLDANEVIVNGKRLPEVMEKKYIARYVRKGSSMSMERD